MPAAKSPSKKSAPKLHRFEKQIVTAGEHFINGKVRKITEADLKEWAENHAKLAKAGRKTPAPFKHRKDAVPMLTSQKPPKGGDGFSLGDSSKNAGYWSKLWVGKTVDAETQEEVPALFGHLDAYGDENDLNTPAGKIAKTVQEVSVYAMSDFTDGKGKKYGKTLLHIAPVVNPVEGGQPNFEYMGEAKDIDEDALILSMSMKIPPKKDDDSDADGEADASDDSDAMDSDGDGEDGDEPIPAMDEEDDEAEDIGPLVQLLAQNGFHLPQDTTPLNFKHRLFVVLNHHAKAKPAGDQGNGGTVQTPPNGAQPKNRMNYAMSIDPKLQKTFKRQDAERREGVKSRIKALAEAGKINEDVAKELDMDVDAFEMSISDGGDDGYVLDPIPVEKTIRILESASGIERVDEFGMSLGGGGNVKPLPRKTEEQPGVIKPSLERGLEIAKQFVATVG